MLNTAILMGRLTAILSFVTLPAMWLLPALLLAVDRSYVKSGADRQVDFIDIVAWRSTGRICLPLFS